MRTESQIPDNAKENLSEKIEDEVLNSITYTRNGQRLSPKEDRFITLYIKYSDATQAAKEAGYTVRPTIKNIEAQYVKRGKELLARDYIRDEISARMEEFRDSQIADAKEVMMYLTKVMRGEEKDQFGLEASLSERTSAAKELNRRLKEIEDTTTNGGTSKEVHLVLRRE